MLTEHISARKAAIMIASSRPRMSCVFSHLSGAAIFGSGAQKEPEMTKICS